MLHQVPPGGACGTHRCPPQRRIARILRRSKGTPTAVDCLDGTGDAKAVIGVLEFRRNAGPRRDSRDLDVVAPGSPALAVIGNLLGWRVAPGIQRAFRAAPRGMLPFGLGGETIIPSR